MYAVLSVCTVVTIVMFGAANYNKPLTRTNKQVSCLIRFQAENDCRGMHAVPISYISVNQIALMFARPSALLYQKKCLTKIHRAAALFLGLDIYI